MPPSSPYVSAPSSERMPPRTHTTRAYPTSPPVSRSTAPGTTKMPEPMTVPTTMKIRSRSRRVRASDCAGTDMPRRIGRGEKLRARALVASVPLALALGGVRPAAQAGPERQERSHHAHGIADELVLVEQAELAQQVVPVVLPAAHERQLLGARILDVDRDVPEALGDPPERHGRGMAIAAAPEVPHEERGHEELHQRPAQGADELPEDSEQRVPHLVDREIEAVEPTVVVGVEHEIRAVEREHGAQGLPGASLAGRAHFFTERYRVAAAATPTYLSAPP